MAKVPTYKKYASDTVRSDSVRRPFVSGRNAADADRKAIDSVRRTKTAWESNAVDNQGNKLDDATIAILRGGSQIKPKSTVKPTPKRIVYAPKTGQGKGLKTKITPRGKGRGER